MKTTKTKYSQMTGSQQRDVQDKWFWRLICAIYAGIGISFIVYMIVQAAILGAR